MPRGDFDRNIARFITRGSKRSPRVYLTCSLCDARLHRIHPEQQVRVDRGYLCRSCRQKEGTDG